MPVRENQDDEGNCTICGMAKHDAEICPITNGDAVTGNTEMIESIVQSYMSLQDANA